MSTPTTNPATDESGWHRRTLLKTGIAAAAVAGGPFAGFVNSASAAVFTADPRTALIDVPDKRDGVVRLRVPEGFQYRSFHDTEVPGGVTLPDGTKLPGRHDGMGAFRGPKGTVALVRNHEEYGIGTAFGPGSSPRYDGAAGGGTTSVVTDRHGNVVDAWTSLSGTLYNCSGGIMPWGAWVTCEETINGPDVGPDFRTSKNHLLEKPHGYIFEVPADKAKSLAHEPMPITAAGRFAHEAVSWDRAGGYLYMTEDDYGFASGFYRYKPKQRPEKIGYLDNEGVLEMLAVKGVRNAHLEGSFERGTTFDVEWVRIDDPDPDFGWEPGEPPPVTNNEAIIAVAKQGWDQGAAYFSRTEGQAYEHGVVFFTSTQGGGEPEDDWQAGDGGGYGNGHGQVWAYDTRKQKLTMVYQSPGPEVLDFPDNVTTRRGTVVLCEDGTDDNYVRALRPDGTLVNLVHNVMYENTERDRTDDEFAGSTFFGNTLFVNIQARNGLTFAIWGPWHQLGI